MDADKELSSMMSILETLKNLEDNDARLRVLTWVTDRLGLRALHVGRPGSAKAKMAKDTGLEETFETFADLCNAASPSTNAQRALVAGFWLQVCQEDENFGAQVVNKELQNVGQALTNVTDAFNQLKNKQPALAIQVRKSGRSQQARKLYKLTAPGIEAVRAMIARGKS